MKEQFKTIVITISVLILGLAVGGELLHLREQAFAQTGGLRREPGFVFTKGCFVELSSGAAVAAGDALYLDSAGKVQKLTAAQAANVVGVADNTVASRSSCSAALLSWNLAEERLGVGQPEPPAGLAQHRLAAPALARTREVRQREQLRSNSSQPPRRKRVGKIRQVKQ